MVAIELVKPDEGDGRVPDPDLTKRIQQEALARNLLVLTAGTYVNVIRIIPPLVTTAEEVDYVVQKLTTVVTRLRDMSPLYELAKEGVDLSTMQWEVH